VLNLLLVEEDSALRDRWTENFRQSGHRVFAFSEPGPALDVARSTSFDVGILSFKDPVACTALQTQLKARNPACQITLLSQRPREEHQAMVLESGARSVLLKPLEPGALEKVIERADKSRRKPISRPPDDTALKAIIGDSLRIRAVTDVVTKLAGVAGTSVLITGESGTGKELVARAIHGMSQRAGEPFLEVNCAAIPEQLLESELFGHEKGAFTDAKAMKPGLFELADRGTLFLDEIGEMGLELQAKLLRVLDTRTIRRLSGQENIVLDVRIVAATNRNLATEVSGGRFRNDLFHRLNVVQVNLPPLRERAGDVRILVHHFLKMFCRKFGRDNPGLAEGVLEHLEAYPWPGNVRELMNQLERAVLMGSGGRLEIRDFPLVRRFDPAEPKLIRVSGHDVTVDFSKGPISLIDVEREIICQALDASGWNISESARLLGLGRGALRYKIDHLEIEKPAKAA